MARKGHKESSLERLKCPIRYLNLRDNFMSVNIYKNSLCYTMEMCDHYCIYATPQLKRKQVSDILEEDFYVHRATTTQLRPVRQSFSFMPSLSVLQF